MQSAGIVNNLLLYFTMLFQSTYGQIQFCQASININQHQSIFISAVPSEFKMYVDYKNAVSVPASTSLCTFALPVVYGLFLSCTI